MLEAQGGVSEAHETLGRCWRWGRLARTGRRANPRQLHDWSDEMGDHWGGDDRGRGRYIWVCAKIVGIVILV